MDRRAALSRTAAARGFLNAYTLLAGASWRLCARANPLILLFARLRPLRRWASLFPTPFAYNRRFGGQAEMAHRCDKFESIWIRAVTQY